MRRVECPSRRAVDSTSVTVSASKSTGSKRASERVATVTPCSGQADDLVRPERLGLTQHGVVGVAQVDREDRRVGHDVHEVGATSNRPIARLGAAEASRQRTDEHRDRRRRRARRRAACSSASCRHAPTAGDRQLRPRDALHALDHPDRDPLVLEDRPLLDVQLDIGMGCGGRRARQRPGVADA